VYIEEECTRIYSRLCMFWLATIRDHVSSYGGVL